MDFFDDLLNSSTIPTQQISKMLEEDLFWQIIENSLQDYNNLHYWFSVTIGVLFVRIAYCRSMVRGVYYER